MKWQNVVMCRPPPEEKAQGEWPEAKLMDFGLSHFRLQPDRKGLMEVRCGTLGYVAPEVKEKNSVIGPEIDMWAFGIMLYEMCFAYKPKDLKNYVYGSGPIPFNTRDLRKINKHIRPVIEGCI